MTPSQNPPQTPTVPTNSPTEKSPNELDICENENTENDKNTENNNKKHSIPTYKGLLIDDIIHDNIPEDVSRDISQPVYFKAELGGLMDIEICDDSGSIRV